MSRNLNLEHTWQSIIGYPWEEARELLRGEAVDYKVRLTSAPGKPASLEESRVIALRLGAPLVVICANQDWTIQREVRG